MYWFQRVFHRCLVTVQCAVDQRCTASWQTACEQKYDNTRFIKHHCCERNGEAYHQKQQLWQDMTSLQQTTKYGSKKQSDGGHDYHVTGRWRHDRQIAAVGIAVAFDRFGVQLVQEKRCAFALDTADCHVMFAAIAYHWNTDEHRQPTIGCRLTRRFAVQKLGSEGIQCADCKREVEEHIITGPNAIRQVKWWA